MWTVVRSGVNNDAYLALMQHGVRMQYGMRLFDEHFCQTREHYRSRFTDNRSGPRGKIRTVEFS